MKNRIGLMFITTLVVLAAGFYFFHKNESAAVYNSSGTTELVQTEAVKNALPNASPFDRQIAAENYGKIPLYFEPNVGQTDERVKFVSRGDGYAMFLTGSEAVLSLRENKSKKSAVVRMQIEGANAAAQTSGIDVTETKTNYFIGNDPTKWQTAIPNFKKVKFDQIYAGVDLVYYGNQRQLEYDFVVQPNADTEQIRLNFDGAKSAKIEKQTGDLLLDTEVGTLRQHAPLAYQIIDGERREIAAGYAIKNQKISFTLATYDKSKELIIDPILAYGSYIGGYGFDEGRAITTDAAGNAYVVGTAASANFPTTAGAIKTTLLPRSDVPSVTSNDAFVTKINPSGTAIVFSTFYGGRNGSESGSGVAVDAGGNVLLSGTTQAADFPTVNAYQTTFGGTDDAFAAKLNPTGAAIIYSTYLGGNNTDTGGKIALNQTTGDAVFTGIATSPNFPTTAGAFRQKICDNTPGSCNGIFYSGGYLVKLSANGAAVYSTLFDSAINDMTLDANDNAVFGGTVGSNFPATPGAFQTASSGGIEGFIAKLNPSGSTILYGTFLGGGLQSDRVNSIAIDASGSIYATGQTQNTGFPTTAGAFDQSYNGGEDAFVTKFNPSGSALVYSTFLGGTGKDQAFGIALGTDNSVFVAGETTSAASFPLKNSLNGANGSIFLTRLNSDANALVFSTYLGQGGAYDVAVDSANNAYLTGHTYDVIVTPNSFQTTRGNNPNDTTSKDAFVLKVAPTDENAPVFSISGTVSNQIFQNYTPVVVTLTGTVNRSYLVLSSGVTSFTFGALPAGGNYTVRAKKVGFLTDPSEVVFNNLQANQFAEFSITPNQKPEATLTSPANNAVFNAGQPITLTATANDPDGNGVAKVDFVAYSSSGGTINIGTDTTAPYEANWNNAPADVYALYAIPTDGLGLVGDSLEIVNITVVDPTTPSVVLTSPANNSTYPVGASIPLNVTVSSSINLIEYYANDVLVGRRFNNPWLVNWQPLDAGTYTVYAKGTTSTNQVFTSSSVTVNITPLNHRISGRITDAANGSGIANVSVALTGTNSIAANTTTDANGNYLFTNLGTTPNDSVTITPTLAGQTFTPANIVIGYLGYIDWTNQNFTTTPVSNVFVDLTSPQSNQNFNAPATVNIQANASTTNGTIAKVEFLYTIGNGVRNLLSTDTTAPYAFTWTNVAAGTYYIIAKATDTNGSTGESSTFINVSAQPATYQISGQVRDANGDGMQGIAVNLTGSQTQTFTTISGGYYFFSNLASGGNYTVAPVRPNTNFTPPTQSFSNLTGDIGDVNFTADRTNQPPTVQINSPVEGATYSLSAPIQFNVTAADADGQVVHLTISAQNQFQFFSVGQTNNGIFNAPWQPTQPGNYTVYAQARDNGGLVTTAQISITINPPAPVSIAGGIVDRNSIGIEGVILELKDYPQELNVVATATTDANGNYTIPNVTTFANYVLRAAKQDYTFSPRQRTFANLITSQTNADFTGVLQVQPSDFDGDGRSDVAVWRPDTGVWYVSRSTDSNYTVSQFGGARFGDVIVPGNYDGDKKIDYAVFRQTEGVWYIYNSSNAQVRTVRFGQNGDKPVAGDFDGDGKTDIAVFRPSDGYWYVLRSSNNTNLIVKWGQAGDVPLTGDYDGDGASDISVWRPSTGEWYTLYSADGNYRPLQFGQNGDVPLVGDFDGDKKTDVAIFRPSTGVWYIVNTSNNTYTIFKWGQEGDRAVPGDYDRDGKTDIAVFRPSDGNWYVFKSSTGTYTIQHFGQNGDVPIAAAYGQ